MEKIFVFRVDNGEVIAKEWIVSDNKEGENEKCTIKEDDFTKLKNKYMKDKEFKKEYDSLQPEYDKIKEDIQKEIGTERGRTKTIDTLRTDFNRRACIVYLNTHKLYKDGYISKKLMEKLLPEGDFNNYLYETLMEEYKIISK